MGKHDPDSHVWNALAVVLVCAIIGVIWLKLMGMMCNVNLDKDPMIRRHNRKYQKVD
ncbi:hypothetical protein DIPPA_25556 [Diplonema papillatum]|nr:hypothetical protein DIPPA_25556 [Diplonema papillatum]